ncbi:MAG: phosphomannomutase/phosphoglucomutase [Gammaproteobacteria bacterium]
MDIDKEIFRAYDIRGIVDKQLDEYTMYLIGGAIGTEVLAQGGKSIVTGRDGRLSGSHLMKALQLGITTTGCHVIDIGMVPTPVVYYATYALDTNSGVMLTGSHNPPEYNGLKIVINGITLTADAIQGLYKRIKQQRIYMGRGQVTQADLTSQYITQITDRIHLANPVKLVIDCGNGVAGITAPTLFKLLGCEVHTLYGEVDGNFPNHHPDPSIPANLTDLIATVKATNADIGLAFDGDGDRLGVVTNEGEIIWPDRQLALFAKDLLTRHPASTIIYDVKCSKHVTDIIRKHGGKPLMYKTGHSFLKAKMQETDALLSGEMSGHIYFKERWFGFDDGAYTGARLLEMMTQQNISSADLFKAIPDSINTPELKLPIQEKNKFAFMEKLLANASFPEAEINTIDGLRVDFSDSWGLVRPSNTTPHLILRFEADDEKGLLRIQQLFRHMLLQLDSTLGLPF